MWLSGGFFLGWAVGANVAATVFATAVAARMLRFSTAVELSIVFIVLGGFINGPAATETLNRLGPVATLPSAFTLAVVSAAVITCMSALGLPVSAAQTAVGALLGYQLFQQGTITASAQPLLRMIMITWICAPVFSALIAFLLYKATVQVFRRLPMPIFLMDQALRLGLILAGCYGAWAFGGNNLANVVGFYASQDLFAPVHIGPWVISQSRILALLGGFAIAAGIASFSHRVMLTLGRDLVKLDAITALLAILAQALVVDFLAHSWEFGKHTLPAIPISVSQALVGAILGIGMARGIQTIKLKILGNIIVAWITAPVFSAGLSYLLLRLAHRLA
jgi:PiT family inorganic phosphate transporter